MNTKATGTELLQGAASITQIIGAQPALFPGQSRQAYEQGATSLIVELQAKGPMQIYLAQKMFDCIWWIRQYETVKQGIIVNDMFDVLTRNYVLDAKSHLSMLKCLQAGNWSNAALQSALKFSEHTPESLYALAVDNCLQKLQHLEQLIALRAKTLTQFQVTFEALVNRPILQERLRMQNQLLARNLSAIEVKSSVS